MITLKGIKKIESVLTFHANIGYKFFLSVLRYKFIKKSRRCRILFPLICEKRQDDPRSRSPTFPYPVLLCSFYIFLSCLTLSRWPRKEKERILKRLVIKSKQKGIDVIEVSRSFSLCFFFFLRLVGPPSFPREIVSEKMAKITSETALFSTGSVNLYIHGYSFIYSNVNPFLFRLVRSPLSPPSPFSFSVFFAPLIFRITCRAVCTILPANVSR